MTRDDSLPARLTERYEARGVLGRGAFGIVHRAWDRELQRAVAIKVLERTLSQEAQDRFRREGTVLAALRHPGVVRVYDSGMTVQGPYLVMELLDGATLEEDPPEDLLAVAWEVASALEALHSQGILHRDIKPANLFRTPEGRVVLLDFGMARGDDHESLTRTGHLIGSLGFLGPEVWLGQEAGAPCDWYALGVSLFLLAEGRLPWTTEELHGWRVGKELPEPTFEASREGDDLRRLMEALLDPDPDRRPVDVETLRTVLAEPGLDPGVAGSPIGEGRGRSVLPWLVGALAFGGLLGIEWRLQEDRSVAGLPRPPRVQEAASEAPLRAVVDEALAELIAGHPRENGVLEFARRGGSPGEHLAMVLDQRVEPRTLGRWRRLLEGLPQWVAATPAAEVERHLRGRVLPALDHLGEDEILLSWYVFEPRAWGSEDPAVRAGTRVSIEVLKGRSEEIAALREVAIRGLEPFSRSNAILYLIARLSPWVGLETKHRFAVMLRERLEATSETAERAFLARGFDYLNPSPETDGRPFTCEERERQMEVLAELARDLRHAPEVSARWRSHATAIALYRTYFTLQACRRELSPEDLPRWIELLAATREALPASPAPVAVELEALLTFQRSGGYLTTAFGEDFEYGIDRLEELAVAADTLVRGTPRPWPPGRPPPERRGAVLRDLLR